MPNDNEKYLLDQQVAFIQHFLPGLSSGEYKLQVDQQVFEEDGTTPVSGQAYTNAYTFAVTSDRFGLAKPGEIIASVFPADNASGEYTNVLPHVVFSKITFPWTRYPTLAPPYAPPPPGKDVDANVPTWLWVMVLDEDDLTEYATLNLNPITCRIGDLYPKKIWDDSKLPDTDASYFYKAGNLSGLEPGQTTADGIQAIDLPLDLFWKIAPTVEDMYQLGHGRVVTISNQATLGTEIIGEPVGSFSIVFGNRLPADKKKSYAYLVSLEELEEFLPQAGGIPPTTKANGPYTNLRLAVLKSWTFFSTGQSATFVHKLESLNGCIPNGTPAENTSIRLEYKGQNKVIGDIFQMGFIPLNETMRTAEKNVAWYRGPLVPYSVPDNAITLPIPSPDGATILDPTTGMLDASYAAAWTIGRMVALQDVSFSTGLYTWKKEKYHEVANNIENKLIDEEFRGVFTAPGLLQDGMPLTAAALFKQTVLINKKK